MNALAAIACVTLLCIVIACGWTKLLVAVVGILFFLEVKGKMKWNK